MSQSGGPGSDAVRRDVRRMLEMTSAKPGMPQDGLRVRNLTIGHVAVPESVSGPCSGQGGFRRHQVTTEVTFPSPCINGVEMPRKPVVLEQVIPQCTTVVSPAGWRFPGTVVHSSGATAELTMGAPLPRSRPGGPGRSLRDVTFSKPMPPVLDGTNRISRLPQRRRGLIPRQIGGGEVESHLNELQAAKGVIPENAVLVAVFRRIPVELISHMRFDQSRRLLLFKLVPCRGRRVTRIYDVAAVKDLSTGNLHLIPHRTRNRTVLLS